MVRLSHPEKFRHSMWNLSWGLVWGEKYWASLMFTLAMAHLPKRPDLRKEHYLCLWIVSSLKSFLFKLLANWLNTSPINSFVVHSRMRISIPISINQDGLSELALCEASFLKSCNYTKRPSLLFLFFAKQIFFRENKGQKEHKKQPLTKYMKN